MGTERTSLLFDPALYVAEHENTMLPPGIRFTQTEVDPVALILCEALSRIFGSSLQEDAAGEPPKFIHAPRCAQVLAAAAADQGLIGTVRSVSAAACIGLLFRAQESIEVKTYPIGHLMKGDPPQVTKVRRMSAAVIRAVRDQVLLIRDGGAQSPALRRLAGAVVDQTCSVSDVVVGIRQALNPANSPPSPLPESSALPADGKASEAWPANRVEPMGNTTETRRHPKPVRMKKWKLDSPALWDAWYLQNLAKFTQTEIAEKLTAKYEERFSQPTVSRMLEVANDFIRGGYKPPPPESLKKVISVDATLLEEGALQRHRKTEDEETQEADPESDENE